MQGITIPARFWYDGQYIHNAKEDAAEEVDELFNTSLSADGIQQLIAKTHAECVQQGEDGEIDLLELGESAWPDMPNVILVQILEELLLAGMDAVSADDHDQHSEPDRFHSDAASPLLLPADRFAVKHRLPVTR